ncbi:MAG: DUF2147 domain-containing protein [Marinicaulis sp.]|nr:DUF2147 domain-containing protein [Marinicaulis sp.]
MRMFFGICVSAIIAMAPVSAAAIDGVWNTGPSNREETKDSSLDIKFHPCDDRPDRFCATIVRLREPRGVSGYTKLPDGSLIVGYTFIRNLKPKGDGYYKRGDILSVDESMVDGEMRWYGLRVQNNFDGTLTATGCLGFICPKKITWRQVIDGEIQNPVLDATAIAEVETESVAGKTSNSPD